MPRNKDLKRLVRSRMSKTGEAYTAARAHIIRKSSARNHAAAPVIPIGVSASTTSPRGLASTAGSSDEAVKQKTGRTWEEWVKALDAHRADRMAHRDIAAIVSTHYGVGDWWSQSVTVGYERIKGLRARGQRRDGTHEMTKSRTFNVPVATLFAAWADASVRARWLKVADATVRTATAPKSMRLRWSDRSIVIVGFLPKGELKSAVAVAHTKLPDRETADRLKQWWSERLDALGDVLRSRAASAGAPRGAVGQRPRRSSARSR